MISSSIHAYQSVFQPIIELETRRVVGFEALTRFDRRHATRMSASRRRHGSVWAPNSSLPRSARRSPQAHKLPAGAFLSLNVSPAVALAAERAAAAAASTGTSARSSSS